MLPLLVNQEIGGIGVNALLASNGAPWINDIEPRKTTFGLKKLSKFFRRIGSDSNDFKSF